MFKFEVNGEYINRKGKYTVLSITPPKMKVRYEDGSTAEVNMGIQSRIWENILVEKEAEEAKRTAKSNRGGTSKTQYFIKAVSVPSLTEMIFAGWAEKVILATAEEAAKMQPGDRILYYAIEPQVFVAVATITSPPNKANPKDYFYTIDLDEAYFFPIDIDAAAVNMDMGVAHDAVELESQPNFRKLYLQPENFLPITEDDFELLAELLTEIAEEEEDDDSDEDEYIEDDED
jgi:hypothetical protein